MRENGQGVTILLVEDDANTLHIMRDYLARANFKIRTAANGWEALKCVKEGAVDLVISELSIADFDGSSLHEKMILNPATRDVPFFFLIPEDQPDNLVHALRSGVDDCITKPFDPIVLVARVQAAIERRRTYEEMVRVDPLTRLLNRPTLQKEVLAELNRVDRYDRPGSMVLLDIDEFSGVNDESGIAMGDLLLTCLAGVVLSSKRNVDIAGRYHGEKFLLYLPETDDLGAEAFAGRMQEKLAVIADSLAGYRLSFSCGLAAVPRDGNKLELLMERLEKALKYAKAHKKGGVAIWGRDVSENDTD